MDISNIIAENDRRHRDINKPYDAVSGKGCYGDRVRIEISDAPCPILYLPKNMIKTAVCKELIKHGSIEKYLLAELGDEITAETIIDFWICFCELRYEYDFEFFAISCITITDKITAQLIPFRLNRGQRILFKELEDMRTANLPIRINLLKSRQWGGSTLIQFYMYWIQLIHKKNWNSVICAHVKDASITIRAMYESSVKEMLPLHGTQISIKPYQGTQNIKYIPERGCKITVGTAIEPESVRSQDAKMAHFSEVALYPNTANNNPESLESSIIGSIPAEPYTMIARETTAKGVGNFFHNEWLKSKRGESAYKAVFVAWYCIDIYSKEFDGRYYNNSGKVTKGAIEDFVKTLDEYELNLFVNHKGCTLENLNWRRLKRSEMTNESMMKQEYPSDDIEAFQDSGSPVFPSEHVEKMRKECYKPEAIGILVADALPESVVTDTCKRKNVLSNIRFEVDKDAMELLGSSDTKRKELKERNKLKVWSYPDKNTSMRNRYVVIYDPSKGLSESADFGSIVVFDKYWMMYGGVPEVVAEWYGRLDKDVVIWIATQIACYYNNALLVVESNTFDSDSKHDDDSEFIFDTIADYYSNLYSRTPADKIVEGLPVKYGFNTNRSTKPMIIAHYVAMLREGGYRERESKALDEARVYEKKANGSYGAKQGYHDDRLMTRMIGCHICYDTPAPSIVEKTNKYRSVKPVGMSSL